MLSTLVAGRRWISGQVCAPGEVLKHSCTGLGAGSLLTLSSTITPTSELLVPNQHYIGML